MTRAEALATLKAHLGSPEAGVTEAEQAAAEACLALLDDIASQIERIAVTLEKLLDRTGHGG